MPRCDRSMHPIIATLRRRRGAISILRIFVLSLLLKGELMPREISQTPAEAHAHAQPFPTENATLLDAILESAMDAIIVVDASQRILLFNHAAESMFGVPRSEIIGQTLDRLLPRRFAGTHRRDVDTFISTGSTSRAMGHLRPLTALRADGSEFPIEA